LDEAVLETEAGVFGVCGEDVAEVPVVDREAVDALEG